MRELTSLAGGGRDPHRDLGECETRTAHGLALSPDAAALCAEDYVRTAVFLRGVRAAIESARESVGGRPVRVLYAGCGPLGMLATPLMSVLPAGLAVFTLVDLHGASVRSARAVVAGLGRGHLVDAFVTGDACEMVVPARAAPDVIVVETMTAGLENETHVALCRRLVTMAPEALLVPESVRVDGALVDMGREIAFVSGSDHGESVPVRDRVELGPVFEVSRETIVAWAEQGDRELPAGSVTFPDLLSERYEPMLMTRIRVFGDHVLGTYDSGLTTPRCMPIEGRIEPGCEVTFRYVLGDRPGLIGRTQTS